MKTTLTLAGLLSLGSTAFASAFPYYFAASIQATDPDSSVDGLYFRPGLLNTDGETLIALGPAPLYFYINETNSQLLMTDFHEGVIGNGYVDDSDKGILKFGDDPDAHDYALFALSADSKSLSMRGASDRWFWCPVEGQTHGTVAIGTVAGLEGCDLLKGVEVTASD